MRYKKICFHDFSTGGIDETEGLFGIIEDVTVFATAIRGLQKPQAKTLIGSANAQTDLSFRLSHLSITVFSRRSALFSACSQHS